jgi:hypothetical protein
VNSIILVVLMACVLAVVLLARKESLHGRGDKSKPTGAPKKKAGTGTAKPSRAASEVEILPPSVAPTSPFQRPPRVIVVDLPPLRPAR